MDGMFWLPTDFCARAGEARHSAAMAVAVWRETDLIIVKSSLHNDLRP